MTKKCKVCKKLVPNEFGYCHICYNRLSIKQKREIQITREVKRGINSENIEIFIK